ncbi:hyaluronan-mediated motility receptor isoform X1 [Nematostella vectensis]|uniref:hyaluronan-mediated motility receptor isoform X1 n=1 Tax=Nematostella vectensis TaxID=45351 RepID=UPI0020772D1E|nr:hyaluronan-mediated motility receptor isoform X1 [Nematostella vectensis]
MFPKAKRFIQPASITPAPGSYDVAKEGKKQSGVRFPKGKRFTDPKDVTPAPSIGHLDFSTCSNSSTLSLSAAKPSRKMDKVKISELQDEIADLENEIRELKAKKTLERELKEFQDRSVNTDASNDLMDESVNTSVEFSVMDRQFADLSMNTDADIDKELFDRSMNTEPEERDFASHSINTDPCEDLNALVEEKESELASLQFRLHCEQENSLAELEMERSRNIALRERLTVLEKTSQDLSNDRDLAEEENRKLHGVASELGIENIQMREELMEKEQLLQDLNRGIESFRHEEEKKINDLRKAVDEEMARVKNLEHKLQEALQSCSNNISRVQARADELEAKNFELLSKIAETEDQLAETGLRKKEAEESYKRLVDENQSLESRLEQETTHNSELLKRITETEKHLVEIGLRKKEAEESCRRLETECQELSTQLEHSQADLQRQHALSATREEQLQAEIHRNEEMMTNSLKSLTAKFESLEQDSASAKSTFERELRTVHAELEATKASLQYSNKQTEEAEFVSISLKGQMQQQQQTVSQLQDELDSSQARVKSLEYGMMSMQEAAIREKAAAETREQSMLNKLGVVENREKQLLVDLEIFSSKAKDAEDRVSEILKVKEEFGRRLVDTQTKFTQSEINFKRKLSEIERENASLQEMIDSKSRNDENELEAQLHMWQTKYHELEEKIEPFKEQLDAFEEEKRALLCQSSQAQSEVNKLSAQYAKLLGHQNNKQKIHHVLKLKQENISLKTENAKLRETNEKQMRALKKMEEKAGNTSKKFNPNEAFQHAKENRPLARLNGNTSIKSS